MAQVLHRYDSRRRWPGRARRLRLLRRRRDAGHVVPGHPKLGEREVLTALLAQAMGLRLLRPDRKDETYRNGNLGAVRQRIESVNQPLKGRLDLEGTAGEPRQACSPGSPSACWLWPRPSGPPA
ncbi:MAG TPA: hypothetical protein VFH84_40425 [Amycolatopsis sp.]|nr:hypothetical protein [Amycolatopsis sp.]HET6711296.1 hypothetical protein [Amycolatopsis sp.]